MSFGVTGWGTSGPIPASKGGYAQLNPLLIGIGDQFHSEVFDGLITKQNHLTEFPGGIHMEKREGRFQLVERLERQVQHDGGIFAGGVVHQRLFGLCDSFANDAYRFLFQGGEVCMIQAVEHQ